MTSWTTSKVASSASSRCKPLGYFPVPLVRLPGPEASPNLAMILAVMVIVLVALSAAWGVTLGLFSMLSFAFTLALAVILNFLIFYCFSAMSFWIIEIGFLFEGIRIVTILLSGGIFPLEVFGDAPDADFQASTISIHHQFPHQTC